MSQNQQFSVAFSILTGSSEVPIERLLQGLENRLYELRRLPPEEAREAFLLEDNEPAEEGPSFDVYVSEEDQVTVVHVDTAGMEENCEGPRIRVYLNDGVIFENPPYPSPPEE